MTPVIKRLKQFALAVLLVVLFPLLAIAGMLALLLFAAYELLLFALIRIFWLARGTDVLLVYSDSPIWLEYMNSRILPLVKDRAKVLNWSKRKQWPRWSLPVRVFRAYSGSRDFNPMLILFRPFRKAVFFRFLSAFEEFKHGKPERLEQMRDDLIVELQRSGSSKGQGAAML
jgi:hypothetical protein